MKNFQVLHILHTSRPTHSAIACPKIHHNLQIFVLFKPIGLCGTINAHKNFRTPPTYFDPPLPRRSSDVRFAIWKKRFLSTDMCNSSFSSSHWVDQLYKRDHGSKTNSFYEIGTLTPICGANMVPKSRSKSNDLYYWVTLHKLLDKSKTERANQEWSVASL